jgi:hypothetical protein
VSKQRRTKSMEACSHTTWLMQSNCGLRGERRREELNRRHLLSWHGDYAQTIQGSPREGRPHRRSHHSSNHMMFSHSGFELQDSYSSGKKLKCYSTTSTTISYVALHILVASNFFPDACGSLFADTQRMQRTWPDQNTL